MRKKKQPGGTAKEKSNINGFPLLDLVIKKATPTNYPILTKSFMIKKLQILI
jgi:hypothetical protein